MPARPVALLLSSFLLLLPAMAWADWPTVPAEALEITPTSRRLASVEDGTGGAHFVWYDGAQLRVLRVSASGSPAAGWPSSGVVVANTSLLLNVATAFDPAGGVYVAWTTSAFQEDVWLQHLDAAGAVVPGWPAGGWQFTSGSAEVSLTHDGQGGVYAVWGKVGGIGATRIQANGTVYPGWLANGKVVLGSVLVYAFADDGAGGCYFAAISGDQVRVDRRDPAGTLVASWSSDALHIGVSSANLEVAPMSNGDLVVGWDWRTDPSAAAQFGITRLTPGGTPAPGWPTGGAWVTLSPNGTGCMKQVRVDGESRIFAVLTVSSGPASEARAWRLTPEGAQAPGWPAGGALLPGASLFCLDALGVLTDGTGGLYYGFRNPSASNEVLVGRIDATASLADGWPATGVVVRSSQANLTELQFLPNGSGGVIAAWRTSDAMGTPLPAEANHVNLDGTLGPAASVAVGPERIPEGLAFALPRPNPARGSAWFVLDLPEEASPSIAVFDPQGRLVRRIAGGTTLPAGTYSFQWNLEDRSGLRVRPGVYLVRAAAGGGAITRSLIVAE